MKGIQFSPESIAAIQARLKTQTRRKIKPQPTPGADAFWWSNLEAKEAMGEGWDYAPSGLWERDERGLRVVAKPRYQPGELVYVKERFTTFRRDTPEESAVKMAAAANVKSLDDLYRWSELPGGSGDSPAGLRANREPEARPALNQITGGTGRPLGP